MNNQYTDEQLETIRLHEDEAARFLRWALGAFTLTVAAIVWLLNSNNILALVGAGLTGLIGCHALVQYFTALNSRDNARGYGNSRMYPYYAVAAFIVAILAYITLR